jgi:hypothetical protein
MCILRTSHNKENPYVMLNKSALEDKNLSWGAKGLWAYLMSRPDNWTVSVTHLASIYDHRGGKERAIYALLNELIEHGYCERVQLHNEKGEFGKIEYVITELKKSLPHRGCADAGEPHAVTCRTNNKGSLISNETTTTTSESSSLENPKENKQKKETAFDQNRYYHDLWSFLEGFIKKHKLSWSFNNLIILKLIKQYNSKYLTDQINYMIKAQEKSIKDSLIPTKKHPAKSIENPEVYLEIACKKNWASSEHTFSNEKK